MKVVKRDGKFVDYERDKIRVAISKANVEVTAKERATEREIDSIIEYIESLGKKRILVEDIQDIIEEKLMELDHYELAKRYIVYRYTRALVRKANTTDDSILSLIQRTNREALDDQSNRGAVIASRQRDLIAGEVSKDLTKRILLPEKIRRAHEEGNLYFHASDYFVQPIFNCCILNIADMLDHGTVINGKLIESPKSFLVACTIVTQLLVAAASGQYGGDTIDLSHLGKYLRKSHDKVEKQLRDKYGSSMDEKVLCDLIQDHMESELSAGIQTLQYQVNTLMTTNGQPPCVTLFLNLKLDDPYLEENAMIMEELLKQRLQGMKNEEGIFVPIECPKLVYVLDEYNSLKGGDYDYLTILAMKCSCKGMGPDYVSAKKMREIYDGEVFAPIGHHHFLNSWKDEQGNLKWEGRFNQGIVTLNLPQIALAANQDEETFFSLLQERLGLCQEALMCRHYSLLGTASAVSPIHWSYGGVSRLSLDEKIDSLLKSGYSSLSLGYMGLYEMTKLMTGETYRESRGKTFALKVMHLLKSTCETWQSESGIAFRLYGTSEQSVGRYFALIDREKYGIIKGITDQKYYTNSYQVNSSEIMDLFSKLSSDVEFQSLSLGGSMSNIELSLDGEHDLKKMEEVIIYISEHILYSEIKKV